MENRNLKRALADNDSTNAVNLSPGIIGESVKLKLAIKTAKLAADTEASVLLNGESGTGKERFARMIHFNSPRRDQPFIAINCAAIPENLLESELFGHEKGAFTGAVQRNIGKFEAADGGTLFLDEIGDMSFDLQSKFLRTLQEGVVQRVGSNITTPVNVRIIAATHKDLQKAIQNSEFRLDLYYRLNVIPIELPPLRDRDGDIPLLAVYFLNRANQRHRRNVSLDTSAFNSLNSYHWPGNIRQLENVIERLVILSEKDRITAAVLEPMLDQESDFSKTLTNISDNIFFQNRPYNRVNAVDREKIIKTLDECRGNKTTAAIRLGLTPRQLQYRIQKLEIASGEN
jgi:Nif-specific regulatory protein